MHSQVKYKGVVYAASEKKVDRRVEKGIFTKPDMAWDWAKKKIEDGDLVMVDTVGANSPSEYPLYSSSDEDGNASKRIIDLHIKGGKGRSYKDLLVVKSKKDLSHAVH